MTDRSQFGAATRSRSWDWLFALRKRLNVDLQLVDDAQTPLLTAAGGAAADSVFSTDIPGLRQAVSTAIRTRTPQAAAADRVQTVVVPITLGREVGGALLVGRRTASDQSLESVRGQLELVGFWLTNAIEAHLQSPPAAQGDLDRLSALCRLLADDAAEKSDREILRTFIETLAVWHDLEAYGYVEATLDEYAREVALPGADPARTPEVIALAALPVLDDDVTRLARSDADRLGFSGGEDVVLARVGDGHGSWLVVVVGSIESDEMQRLSLYVSLLEQSVARATDAATARVLATLSQLLLADSGSPEEQARQAIRHLQRALGAGSAAFTVTSRTGAPLLHVGQSFTAQDLTSGSSDGKAVVIRRDPQHYAMALVVTWSDDHRVTQQEDHVVQAVADLLESWVRRLVRQSPAAGDRRVSRRGFNEVLERFARDAVKGGVPVTAIVISFGDAALRPDATQARVVRLREHLRGSDMVGRLDEGDVGVLAYDTVAAQADALTVRLRRLLERDGVAVGQVSIGIATRRPGDTLTGALADEARQRARSYANDN